uniref:Uncharacterized protein n=1 Tax=Ditylum brightwellii TaxID=49249 RepID=A0A7S1ZIA9_9STRA
MSRRSSLEDIGAMRNQRKMQQRPSMDALEKGIMAMESEVVAGVMAKEKTPSESHRNKLVRNNSGRTINSGCSRSLSGGGGKMPQRSSGNKLERRSSGGKLEQRSSGGKSERRSSRGKSERRGSSVGLDLENRLENRRSSISGIRKTGGISKMLEESRRDSTCDEYSSIPKCFSSSALDALCEASNILEVTRRPSEDAALVLSNSIRNLEMEEQLGIVDLQAALKKQFSLSTLGDKEDDESENKEETNQLLATSNTMTSKNSKDGEDQSCLLGWGANESSSESSSEERDESDDDTESEEPDMYEDFPTLPVAKRQTGPAEEEFDSRRPWRKGPVREVVQRRQSFSGSVSSNGHLDKFINANFHESDKFDHTEMQSKTVVDGTNGITMNGSTAGSMTDILIAHQKGSFRGAGDTLTTTDPYDSDSDSCLTDVVLAQAALDQALTLQSRIIHSDSYYNSRNKMAGKFDDYHRAEKCDESPITEKCNTSQIPASLDDESFFKANPIVALQSTNDEPVPLREIKTTNSSRRSFVFKISSGLSRVSSKNSIANDQASVTSSVKDKQFNEAFGERPTLAHSNKSSSSRLSDLSLMSANSSSRLAEGKKKKFITRSAELAAELGLSEHSDAKRPEQRKDQTSVEEPLLPVFEDSDERDGLSVEFGECGGRILRDKIPSMGSLTESFSSARRNRKTRGGANRTNRGHKRKFVSISVVLVLLLAVSAVVFVGPIPSDNEWPLNNTTVEQNTSKNVPQGPSSPTPPLLNASGEPSNMPTISISLSTTQQSSLPLQVPSMSPTASHSQVSVPINQTLGLSNSTTTTMQSPSTPPSSSQPSSLPSTQPSFSLPSMPPSTLSQMPSQAPSLSPTDYTSQTPTKSAFESVQLIDGPQELDFTGKSVSFSSDATYLAVGFQMANEIADRSGAVRVYRKGPDGYWAQFGDVILGINSGDEFGYAVSISDNGQRVAVGARFSSDNGDRSGQARVFEYNETSLLWDQLGGIIEGEKAGDSAGYSVSVSGDGYRVAVGSPKAGNNVGSVRIFQYDGISWSLLGQEIFGESVRAFAGNAASMSHDGNTVAIGFRGSSEVGFSSGRVSVYYYFESEGSGSWVKLGQDIYGEAAGDESGQSVSLSSDGLRVAIGANGRDKPDGTFNAGYCRVFGLLSNNVWIQIGSPIYGADAAEQLGWSVSLSKNGQRVACGGPNGYPNGPRSGVVRVYEESEGDWAQLGETLSSFKGSAFGESISLSSEGNYLAVGAPEWGTDGKEDVGFVGVYLYQ